MGRVNLEKRAARELWEEFRETRPGRSKRIPIQWPKVLMVMGVVRRIDYDTTHGGKFAPYKHLFAPGSRPLLCAGKKRGQLFLIGHNFRVTRRGIVDVDGAGRPRKVARR
jgi:hypothetical protein